MQSISWDYYPCSTVARPNDSTRLCFAFHENATSAYTTSREVHQKWELRTCLALCFSEVALHFWNYETYSQSISIQSAYTAQQLHYLIDSGYHMYSCLPKIEQQGKKMYLWISGLHMLRELLEYVTLWQEAARMASAVPKEAPCGHLYFQDLCCCMWVCEELPKMLHASTADTTLRLTPV